MQTLSPQDYQNSIIDGIFASVFGTLTGGVFLTGFALYLGMDEFLIGLLAATPYAATLFQLPASFLIAKTGKRKKIAFWNAAAGRLMWVVIIWTAFLPDLTVSVKCMAVLGLIFLSHSFISISYVSWFSWTSDLIPDEQLGRFFGTRNMINGLAGMLSIVVFGHFVDYIHLHFKEDAGLGFSFTFLIAVVSGMASLGFLYRVSEPGRDSAYNSRSFTQALFFPLKEKNFRNFLIFAFSWNFSVYFASPFIPLYFLRDLKFSYGFVATLGMISLFADLTGMKIWGAISDRLKNRLIIQTCCWGVSFIPFCWIWVKSGYLVIPIVLHLVAGAFWAGINLCSNNMVLRISDQQNRAISISAYNMVGGLGATLGPIVAGMTVKVLSGIDLQFIPEKTSSLHIVFLVSTICRLLSLSLLSRVHEKEETTARQLIRVLRNVRGLNTTNGFSAFLHPFIEVKKTGEKRQDTRSTPSER